jgi:uracil-DNA glycosylase
MKLDDKFIGDWYEQIISVSISDDYLENILPFLDKEYKKNNIYPKKKDVFKAFKLTQFKDTRVVILGQDPYFDGSATGLAFANNDTITPSPSLVKIEECIEQHCYNGFNLELNYTLKQWANQGILLMNTALTVKKGQPASHLKYWKKFTKAIIDSLNYNTSGIIFLLWGAAAHKYESLINKDRHYVLKHTHPAYASRKKIDWNCTHFNEVNEIITKNNGREFCIEW